MSLRQSFLMMVLALVVVGSALAFLHPDVTFRGKIYASSDAQAAAAFQSLGDGSGGREFPHWNPFVFMGMPSYASLAHNPDTYPLTRPLRVLRDALGLPPMFWLLFHLGLAGLGTVAWLRWRGESWAVSIAAGCWIIALPKLSAWGAYGHGTKVGSFAWFPLVGWCAEATLRRGGWGWASGLAFGLSMMLLRGHVQIAYYALMFLGILVIAAWAGAWRDPVERRTVLLRTGWIALAGIVALGTSLELYLPVLQYQAHSVRGAASQGGGALYSYATNWSLSWQEFATMWWPTVAGYGRAAYVGQMPFTDYPQYIGLPLILLALAGVVARRDRMTWALVAVIVLATLLALGRNFFLYHLFFELLPGFRKFRVPVMILILQQLAIILLAARGLGALVPGSEGKPKVGVGGPVLLLVGVSGLFGLILGAVGGGPFRDAVIERLGSMAGHFGRPVPPVAALREAADLAVGDALRIGAILLASVLVVAAAQRRRIPPVAAVVLVALFVFVDLWSVDQPLLRPEHHLSRLVRSGSGTVLADSPPLLGDVQSLENYTKPSGLARWLHGKEARPRVLPLGGLESDNRLAAQGVVSLGGYHAAKLKLYEDLRSRIYDPESPAFRLARMFGAHWVVTPAALSPGVVRAIGSLGLPLRPEPVYEGDGGVAYAIERPLPRAWVVSEVVPERAGEDRTAVDPDPAVLDRILDPAFDPARTAILSARPTPVPQPGAEAAAVEVLEEGYNSWSARVDLPAAGVLVAADVWYPGWKVSVDGEPARLLRANYAERAVALPAGVHVVEFGYGAGRYHLGRKLAALSGLLILAGWLVAATGWLRRRKREEAV